MNSQRGKGVEQPKGQRCRTAKGAKVSNSQRGSQKLSSQKLSSQKLSSHREQTGRSQAQKRTKLHKGEDSHRG